MHLCVYMHMLDFRTDAFFSGLLGTWSLPCCHSACRVHGLRATAYEWPYTLMATIVAISFSEGARLFALKLIFHISPPVVSACTAVTITFSTQNAFAQSTNRDSILCRCKIVTNVAN